MNNDILNIKKFICIHATLAALDEEERNLNAQERANRMSEAMGEQ